MSPRIKLQVQSIIVTGIFCFLASGSMDNSSSNNSTASSNATPSAPETAAKPSAPTVDLSLQCDDPGGSGGDVYYLFYGDALKEFFTITSHGKIDYRVALSLFDITDSFYAFSCSELSPGLSEVRGCSSYKLNRVSLELEANHTYNSTMAAARGSDTSTDTLQCKTMTKDEAEKVLAQRNQDGQK